MTQARVTALVVAMTVTMAAAASVAVAQGGGEPPRATDVGVTAKEIRIGVVADVESPLSPGLFKGSVDGVKAVAKYLNKHGGVAGRKVVVDVYDSKLSASEARNGIIGACGKDFATVGTSALFLNNVEDLVGCRNQAGNAVGLPDLPVAAYEFPHQCSPVSFPINPPWIDCSTKDQHPQTYRANGGRAFYYRKKFGTNLHGLYLYGSDLKAAENGAIASSSAMRDVGITADEELTVSGLAPQAAYTPFVQAMKDARSNYAQSGSDYNTTILLRKEAKIQNLQGVDVWDCQLQCYDRRLLVEGGSDVEGQYVSLLFVPFEEAKSNKMLANYLRYVGRDNADGFGVQAFAAGILFRDAVNAVVRQGGNNALTREALLDALADIHAFDADGMIGTIDVGARTPSRCFALVQVRDGEFVRVVPKKPGTFDCKKRNLRETQLDLG